MADVIDKTELFNQIRQGNLQAIEEESEQELTEYEELEKHFKAAVRNCMQSGFTNFMLVSWVDEELVPVDEEQSPASYIYTTHDMEDVRDIMHKALIDLEDILEKTP